MRSAQVLAGARRLVVKVGSSLLLEPAGDSLRDAWLDAFADDLADLRRRGVEVVVVSSGAVGLGCGRLGLRREGMTLEHAQAAAAVGQIALAHAYHERLQARDIVAAQILLTLNDTEHRRRYLNARRTVERLLGFGVIPVVNENDTVATDEIRYGDNDRLAARVAQMISADLLVLLSDVDGLYDADPRVHPDARHVPYVETITPALEVAAGKAGTGFGTGGMATKIAAARIAAGSGCQVILASGIEYAPLAQIADGALCTVFDALDSPRAARKQWLASALEPRGSLHVDAGAVRALTTGSSLLPVGVRTVDGEFERGEAVRIVAPDGQVLAHGLTGYGHTEARRLCGLRSEEIAACLGYRGNREMVHRDDLAMLGGQGEDNART